MSQMSPLTVKLQVFLPSPSFFLHEMHHESHLWAPLPYSHNFIAKQAVIIPPSMWATDFGYRNGKAQTPAIKDHLKSSTV